MTLWRRFGIKIGAMSKAARGDYGVREIARVLKIGGRVLNIAWRLLTILTFGSVQFGHVIGSKSR